MTVINYATVRTRPRWLAWPTLVAAVLLAHFLISVGIWLYWCVGLLRNPDMRDLLPPSLPPCAPAFLLCGASAVVLVLAVRGRVIGARRGVLLTLIAALAFFWSDVHFQRYQISVGVATKEYWERGGRKHEYFTWWWFNDRWFDRVARRR